MEMATFWNKKHPLSAKADKIFNLMVPGQGKCDTVEGELLRASSKIGYDWYNNGWGCNNWSGAVVFIRENIGILELPADQLAAITHELNYVYEYSHGEPCNMNYNGRNCRAVTTIHEIIVQGILNSSPVDWMGNEVDMLDLTEEDYIPNEEDEEGYYEDQEEDE